MKKVLIYSFKVVLITILLFLCFSFNIVKANTSEDIDVAINSENGGIFEGTIATAIGGIAKAVFNIATTDTINLGFKNYDELIFNKDTNPLAPLDNETWNKIMNWYRVFTALAFVPILIGALLVGYKFIIAGTSIQKRNEAKDSLTRLFFGGVAISIAPFFVKLLLFINANLVSALVSTTTGGLDSLLGNGVFTQIRTGSAIATALVICMFAYLFVKINIKFIIRKFTLIVFTVFTPLVAGLWIINRNVTAASIWFGQILINVFMQFIYSFLFLIYMSFTAVSDGWAVSLLWAMMILPLSDVLLNMMQNLVSRVAGLNNEEIANRGIGMGATMAYTVHTIGSQFKNNISNTKASSGVINRINNLINKDNVDVKKDTTDNTTDTSSSSNKENTNVSRNTGNVDKNEDTISDTTNNSNFSNQEKINRNNNSNEKRGISLYGIGRGILNTGMLMAEGRNFSNKESTGERRNYGMSMRRFERDSSIANDQINKERENRNDKEQD